MTPADQSPPAKPARSEPARSEPASARAAADRCSAEPMQERARRTRRAIMLSAAGCFSRVGYTAATTSGIAERAGVTKGALAFHFPAKAALAVAIVEECYSQWLSLVAEESPAHDCVLDLLGAVFARVALQIREDPIVRATVRLQSERSQIAEELHPPYVDWIATVTELLRDASDRGEIPANADPAALARASVAGFQGVQHVSGMLSGHADVTDRVAEWWALTRAGLACDDQGS